MEQIQKDNEERQRTWQEEFEAQKAQLDEGKRVSDNVKVNVQTDVKQLDNEINLVVTVSYIFNIVHAESYYKIWLTKLKC